MNIKPTLYKAPPLGIHLLITSIEERVHHYGDYIIYTANLVPYFITNREAEVFLKEEIQEKEL